MSDLIDRMEPIEHFRRIVEATDTDTKYSEGFVDGLEFCISHLSVVPPAAKWTPTRSGYPTLGEDVWVSSERYVQRARALKWDGFVFFFDDSGHIINNVVAWTPINVPSPYKEEAE